ncbi:MAG: hypothetical protein CM1200mP27_09350 [Chloroflexota bacterium]|nr:MAG: hypothetical protein CM1200mP27_09350 [Chloroflexota bacterium]
MGTLYLWQIPGGFNLALRNEFVHALMHMTMMSSGFIFYWASSTQPPALSRTLWFESSLPRADRSPKHDIGAVIIFSKSLVYTGYQMCIGHSICRLLLINRSGSSTVGTGDMMSVLAAGIVMIMWYQREEAINPLVPLRLQATTNMISQNRISGTLWLMDWGMRLLLG